VVPPRKEYRRVFMNAEGVVQNSKTYMDCSRSGSHVTDSAIE
jgi:hypothetical protein